MPNPWIRELWRMIAWFSVALFVGWLIGKTHAALTLSLVVYLAWHMYNLYRLERWYYRRKQSAPPESSGIWGEAFHHLSQLQKRNRQRKQRLASIVTRFKESTAAMPDATVILTEDDHIEWFNKAAKRYLGLKSNQDVGQKIGNLIRHPRFIEFMARGNYSEPLELPSQLDHHSRFSFRVVPYARNQKLLVVRDITRIKKLERMRSDFVANVSHELRTPLTVVTGYLENIIDDTRDLDVPWRKSLLQMESHTARMRRLVEDLLMLSRMENGEKPSSSDIVAVPALISAYSEDAKLIDEDKSHVITLNCDHSLWLRGSEKELGSAFSNVIFNAVHYTPDQGHIQINWYAEGDKLIFEVKDNGIGISENHISRLTERFYRVDAGRSREAGGTGLGLAIVKHALDRHDAKLEIESKPGQGSVFRFLFPYAMAFIKDEDNAKRLSS